MDKTHYPSTSLNPKFNVGDRVKFPKDVWTFPFDYKFGTIVERYGMRASKIIGGFWYDELYAVQFDNEDNVRYSHLPHGLERA